jgi:hypothetical protein
MQIAILVLMKSSVHHRARWVALLLAVVVPATSGCACMSAQPCEVGGQSDAGTRVAVYFGRDIEGRELVTREQFEAFLDTHLTPHVAGLTVAEAEGRYRMPDGSVVEEPSFMVILLLSAHQAPAVEPIVQETAAAYIRDFRQHSVLIERSSFRMQLLLGDHETNTAAPVGSTSH